MALVDVGIKPRVVGLGIVHGFFGHGQTDMAMGTTDGQAGQAVGRLDDQFASRTEMANHGSASRREGGNLVVYCGTHDWLSGQIIPCDLALDQEYERCLPRLVQRT